MNDLLQQGIAAARAGRRDEARDLLMQLLETDDRNEQGWLWLSGVMTNPDEIRVCLENVLEINPNNNQARQGLVWVESRYGPSSESVSVAEAPSNPPVIPPAVAEVVSSERLAATGATVVLEQPSNNVSVLAAPVAQVSNLSSSLVPTVTQPAIPAFPMRPQEAVQARVAAQAEMSQEAAEPCFYCGAPTTVAHTECPQCRRNLMVRGSTSAGRSLQLSILAVLTGIGSVLTLLAGGIFFLVGIMVSVGANEIRKQPELLDSELQNLPPGTELPPGFDVFQMIDMLGPIMYGLAIGMLLGGLLYIFVSMGLWRRQRWAYFFAVLSAVFGAIGALLSLIVALSVGSLDANTTLSLMIQSVMIALTVMSYHDFYGKMVRYVPASVLGSAVEHYNAGVAYKKQGMWYQSMREWEAAVAKAPTDVNYLHALGLAYVQVKRFDQARATLDRALGIAPDNTQLQESRALIDRMAST